MLPYAEFEEASQKQQPRARVTLSDWDDVRFWCDYFDCTEGRLREAIACMGVVAEDVAAFINQEIPLAYRDE